MPSIPFYMAGEIGIVRDIEPHELPPQAWSAGRNIKFRDGKAIRRDGQLVQYIGLLGIPYWLMLTYTPANVYWVYADTTKLYAADGTAHADVSRVGDYTTITPNVLWNGGMFSGIPVITNGLDIPQAWLAPGMSTDFADLPNWPSNERAKIIRPFKNFLVAMNISRSGISFENMIHWSHPADPGSVPSSWDSANPATLAGERDLPDEFPGGIQESRSLRDILVIYKDNSVWGMQFIGGTQVFRTYQILGGIGILGSHCVTDVNEGKQHAFASGDDFIIFDGQTTSSILDKKMKKHLSSVIDQNVKERSFVFAHEPSTEAWFCYPETGHDYPNMAIIWNWKENTLTERSLGSETPMIDIGPVTIFGDPWDLDTQVWDDDLEVWDTAKFRAGNFDIVGVQPKATVEESKFVQFEINQTFDGTEYSAYVERTDIALIGEDRAGALKADFEVRKIATRIKPRISGVPVLVSIGKQEELGGGVAWAPAQTFTPGVDKYLDFTVNGLLIAVKFESITAGVWTLNGFNLNIEPLGEL